MARAKPVDVDAYIAAFPTKVQARLQRIRRIIRRVAPGATEKISYGIPAYALDRMLVYFAAFTGHIGMYPISLQLKKTLGSAAAPYAPGKATSTMRFPHDRPLPVALIARIVELRAEAGRAPDKRAARGKASAKR